MQDQRAEIEWREGQVPVSTRFDDPYFSLENGLAETQHVFLAGNGLPDRFCDGFHVAELGFGTGLNFLATWQAWVQAGSPGQLNYTSFEAFPMTACDMKQALGAFPEVGAYAETLTDKWTGAGRVHDMGDGVTLDLVIGDARDTLPGWKDQADAWFLDGFSPAKNPELWGAPLMQQVARHTATGGTIATYTAAGFVRRGLQSAGFEVTRVAGYGRKRHMTTAVNGS